MKSKPDLGILDRYSVVVKSDTIFAARARLLQSHWRESRGYPFEKYGNLLPLAFARRANANFLTPDIGKLVEEELKNIGDRVISEPRIWNNLLSSQPLAFNLFGELKLEQGFKNMQRVLALLFPGRINQVTRIEFEYSAFRRNPKYTNDGSAFDVFIEYISEKAKKCFFGIEVKYSESMNDTPARLREEYDRVAQSMGVFKQECMEDLRNTKLQQLWRDHLLTGSMFISNSDYDRGDFIVLYPQDNLNCAKTIQRYMNTLNGGDNYFIELTLERFHKALASVCQAPWVQSFYDRYLDFEKLKTL